MAEIKLKKRYKYVGDIFQKLIGIGFNVETATAFLNEVKDADVEENKDCEKCIYFGKHATEYPCSHCRNCYTDNAANSERLGRFRNEEHYFRTYRG